MIVRGSCAVTFTRKLNKRSYHMFVEHLVFNLVTYEGHSTFRTSKNLKITDNDMLKL